MDRAILEQHLAVAERHVALGTKAVARQQRSIANLERYRGDTRIAYEILTTFEFTLRILVADRDRLARELEGKVRKDMASPRSP